MNPTAETASMAPLVAQPPDALAFAPFGTFVEAPAQYGGRTMYSDWIQPIKGLTLQLHINHVQQSRLPFTLSQVERHPHANQVFIPLDVERYLITVMPALPDGNPHAGAALSFILPGSIGVIFLRNVWHAGATVLDRDGKFAVAMWKGREDDDVMCATAPLIIQAPEVGIQSKLDGR